VDLEVEGTLKLIEGVLEGTLVEPMLLKVDELDWVIDVLLIMAELELDELLPPDEPQGD